MLFHKNKPGKVNRIDLIKQGKKVCHQPEKELFSIAIEMIQVKINVENWRFHPT